MNFTKRSIAFLLCVLTLLLIAGGITYAILKKSADPIINRFSAGEIGCEIEETFDGTDKTVVKVQNTGNAAAYIRVKLVTYWKDADGAVAALAPAALNFTLGEGWITDGKGTYYYTLPVAGGGKTGNLIADGSKITLTQTADGMKQVVDVLAESIQAAPKEAAEGAWNVTISSTGVVSLGSD